MRYTFSRALLALVLAICFVCPIVEMFDHWNHTAQTGTDTEYALVVVALCVGVAYSFERFIKPSVALCISRFAIAASVQMSFLSAQFSCTSRLFDAIAPPHLEIRI